MTPRSTQCGGPKSVNKSLFPASFSMCSLLFLDVGSRNHITTLSTNKVFAGKKLIRIDLVQKQKSNGSICVYGLINLLCGFVSFSAMHPLHV